MWVQEHGVISIIFLVVMILLFRSQRFRRMKIIKYGCVFSPLICMIFSIVAGVKYDEYSFLKILDMMLQGRIAQNNAYLDRYDISYLDNIYMRELKMVIFGTWIVHILIC